MSGHQPIDDDREPMVDTKKEWAVYRCAHGCVHVEVDRLTLTFTDDEFRMFQDLIQRATCGSGQLVDRSGPATRAH